MAPIGGCGEICLGGSAVGLHNGANVSFSLNKTQKKVCITHLEEIFSFSSLLLFLTYGSCFVQTISEGGVVKETSNF